MALAGKRVLLLEDQLLIALEAEENLLGLGAESVFIAASVAEAMAMMENATPDFAILDINLGPSGTSFPVAEALARQGVPFAFATGYGEEIALPAAAPPTCVIRKPYNADMIAQAIRAAFP